MKSSMFALAALLATGQAYAAPGADMQLTSDLNSMSVDVCVSTPDIEKCPDPPSASRKSGVMDGVIAVVRATGSVAMPAGTPFVERAFGGKMAGGRNSALFGLAIDRPSGKLNCLVSRRYHPSSGESQSDVWEGVVLAPGQSVDAGDVGYCKLADDGTAATIMANCDTTTGGDADRCERGTVTARIVDTAPCSETVETGRHTYGVLRGTPGKIVSRKFWLCG